MEITDIAKFAFLGIMYKELFKDAPAKAIMAGGAFSSSLVGRKVKDIDIFTDNPAALIEHLKANSEIKHQFENDWVCNFGYKKYIVQVIKKYTYQTPEAVIADFDFTIVCCAYAGEKLVYHERFFADNAQMRCVVNNLSKPLSSLQRLTKYCSRGYSACPIGIGKIARAITALNIDWDNPNQNEVEFYPDGTPKFNGLD